VCNQIAFDLLDLLSLSSSSATACATAAGGMKKISSEVFEVGRLEPNQAPTIAGK